MSNETNKDYKVAIEEAILKIYRVGVNPSISLSHTEALKHKQQNIL